MPAYSEHPAPANGSASKIQVPRGISVPLPKTVEDALSRCNYLVSGSVLSVENTESMLVSRMAVENGDWVYLRSDVTSIAFEADGVVARTGPALSDPSKVIPPEQAVDATKALPIVTTYGAYELDDSTGSIHPTYEYTKSELDHLWQPPVLKAGERVVLFLLEDWIPSKDVDPNESKLVYIALFVALPMDGDIVDATSLGAGKLSVTDFLAIAGNAGWK